MRNVFPKGEWVLPLSVLFFGVCGCRPARVEPSDYRIEFRNVAAPVPVRILVDGAPVYEGPEEQISIVRTFPGLERGATRSAIVEMATPDGWKTRLQSRLVDAEEERERKELEIPVLLKLDHEIAAAIPGVTAVLHTAPGQGMEIRAGALHVTVPALPNGSKELWLPRPAVSGVAMRIDDKDAGPFPAANALLIDASAARCYRLTTVTYTVTGIGQGPTSKEISRPGLVHELDSRPTWVFETPPPTIQVSGFESTQVVLAESSCADEASADRRGSGLQRR